jgi:CDP-2,3-bis-(O-geranylgeranyl)-sn-glycerol synthase
MHARWLFLPVGGAWIAHAPVLRWDLLAGLNLPMDGGRTLRGRRLFGDNKTWRGALVMSSGVFAATLGLYRSAWYRERLPAGIREISPPLLAALLAIGTVGGELPNSLMKRQLGVAPGGQRTSVGGVALSLLDQGDFVFAIWLLLAPLWRMSPRQALDAFATVAVIHSGVNVAGYAIGARTSPI